jgi:hypothetical protein
MDWLMMDLGSGEVLAADAQHGMEAMPAAVWGLGPAAPVRRACSPWPLLQSAAIRDGGPGGLWIALDPTQLAPLLLLLGRASAVVEASCGSAQERRPRRARIVAAAC